MERHKKKKEEEGDEMEEGSKIEENTTEKDVNKRNVEEEQPQVENSQKEEGNMSRKDDEGTEQSNYKELLNSSMRENAKRIQKEFIERENSANEYLEQQSQLVANFDKIRQHLQSRSNYYLNYLFCFLGYRYESKIKNINFFHFASQSWIVEVFKHITLTLFCECGKKRIKEEGRGWGNHSFSEILNLILKFEADEKKFLKTLEMIAGTIYFNDVAIILTEVRLGRIFLSMINMVSKVVKN